VDTLTNRTCEDLTSDVSLGISYLCKTAEDKAECVHAGGRCRIISDGYFIQIGICTVIGIAWLAFFYKRIQHLQNMKVTEWRVKQ